jgi:alcohol dehydrogenase (cytochrome c)
MPGTAAAHRATAPAGKAWARTGPPASIVALNPDTGKIVWYFQPSPHDVHDWDAVETPVLVDGMIEGKPRKLVVQASRNGYFFVLDRATGKQILTKPFIDTLNCFT